MELLVEKIISSAGMPLSPGDSLRRVMEGMSSNLLIYGPGILDPCEKDPHDAIASLSKQQREDLCVSSQECLRLIAFRQIFKVRTTKEIIFIGNWDFTEKCVLVWLGIGNGTIASSEIPTATVAIRSQTPTFNKRGRRERR